MQHRATLDEIGTVLDAVDLAAFEAACAAIAGARRIVLYGCGREALQVKGFAMRLFHLGLDVGVAGEMTASPVGKGDLFFVSSGPGELATVLALIGQARQSGARSLVLIAEPAGSAARAADQLLIVPAQTMASDLKPGRSDLLPMGSVYEGALFVLFEMMVLDLKARLGIDDAAMRARHTNLE